jgi:hypothetical protein
MGELLANLLLLILLTIGVPLAAVFLGTRNWGRRHG